MLTLCWTTCVHIYEHFGHKLIVLDRYSYKCRSPYFDDLTLDETILDMTSLNSPSFDLEVTYLEKAYQYHCFEHALSKYVTLVQSIL